jgi:hypothetical protein
MMDSFKHKWWNQTTEHIHCVILQISHNTIYFLLNNFKYRMIKKAQKFIPFFRSDQTNDLREQQFMRKFRQEKRINKIFSSIFSGLIFIFVQPQWVTFDVTHVYNLTL